jgi:type II secretory pathway pseudopilin PulG
MARLKQKRRLSGFTLTEIIIAAAIVVLTLGALTSFMVSSTKDIFWATNKSIITNDVRSFTQRISNETLGANTGYVYKSFSASDRNSASDQKQSGQTGDCLVLIHIAPYPNIGDDKHYTKLVIYFRAPDENGESPVYRVEKTFDTPQPIKTENGHNHFEKFLTIHFPRSGDTSNIVLELSRGLADGNLFRNFGNNTFIINGEILHGNNVKEVTNTYNLTISPRG